MPELWGFLKGHVHLWNSGNRVWHHLSISVTVKEEQAAGTFLLLIPPDWGVRPKKAVLYSAARLRYKNGISALLNLANWVIFLRVDYEHITLLQKEELRRNSHRTCLCVHKGLFIPRYGLGLRAVADVATRTCLLYTRQQFVCKVSVHPFPHPPVIIMLCSVLQWGLG